VSSAPISSTIGTCQSQSDSPGKSHVDSLGNNCLQQPPPRLSASQCHRIFQALWSRTTGGRLCLFLTSITIEESDHETAQEKTATMLNSGSEPRSTGEANQGQNSLEHLATRYLEYATKDSTLAFKPPTGFVSWWK
jgi:hypothetical protein